MPTWNAVQRIAKKAKIAAENQTRLEWGAVAKDMTTPRQRVYIPRLLANQMWAATRNSTSVHFGTGHRCIKHNKQFDLAHLQKCNLISGCEKVKEVAASIKASNLREWGQIDLTEAVVLFKSFSLQISQLISEQEAVETTDVKKPYVPAQSGRKEEGRGPPKWPQEATAKSRSSCRQG